jgi:ketosteroid isomerase-like protein
VTNYNLAMRLLASSLLAALALAPSNSAAYPQARAPTPEQEIRRLETQWNEARAHADVAALDRILADDWTVTHANGTTDTKATYLADLRSGARKFSGAVSVSDFAVRVYGDTAVAAGSSDSTVTLNGQPQGGQLHFTRVYVKRNGAWKMIVSHATTLARTQSLPPAYPRAGATRLFENDRVVVWNIAWLKGQPTPLHRHVYDLTGVYYEPGDRLIIGVDGSQRPVTTKAGDLAFQRKGITHIEEGTSDAPLKAVFVEMKIDGPFGKAAAPASGAPAFSGKTMPVLDNERVTVWDLTEVANRPARHRHSFDSVVAWIDDGGAHARFVPRGTVHDDEGVAAAARVTAFELK